jgi:hypothetical protein
MRIQNRSSAKPGQDHLVAWPPRLTRPREGTEIAPRLRPPRSEPPTPDARDGRNGASPSDQMTRRTAQPCADPAAQHKRTDSAAHPKAHVTPVSQTGGVEGHPEADRHRRNLVFCREFLSGAAQESNLPTVGLPRPAGFEDQTSLAQRSGLSGVCAPNRAPGAVGSQTLKQVGGGRMAARESCRCHRSSRCSHRSDARWRRGSGSCRWICRAGTLVAVRGRSIR